MNATESTMARILSLFILALLPLFVQAQLRFTAQIPSHGEVNGQLRVQFTLNGAEGDLLLRNSTISKYWPDLPYQVSQIRALKMGVHSPSRRPLILIS